MTNYLKKMSSVYQDSPHPSAPNMNMENVDLPKPSDDASKVPMSVGNVRQGLYDEAYLKC